MPLLPKVLLAYATMKMMTVYINPKTSAPVKFSGFPGGMAESVFLFFLSLKKKYKVTPIAPRKTIPSGKAKVLNNSGLKIMIQMKTRITIIDEAASMAIAQFSDKSGCSLLFREKTQVTAVLETSPPMIPLSNIPLPAPMIRINTYPIKPKPDVRMMTHPISRGLITS